MSIGILGAHRSEMHGSLVASGDGTALDDLQGDAGLAHWLSGRRQDNP